MYEYMWLNWDEKLNGKNLGIIDFCRGEGTRMVLESLMRRQAVSDSELPAVVWLVQLVGVRSEEPKI